MLKATQKAYPKSNNLSKQNNKRNGVKYATFGKKSIHIYNVRQQDTKKSQQYMCNL